MSLREFDPATLARETVHAALDRIRATAMGIDPRLSVRVERDGKPWDGTGLTTLGHAVQTLTIYAQTGAPLEASVHKYCVTLVGVADDALDDASRPDTTTDLGIVIAAALCRESLEQGQPVRTGWLAALAGVTIGRVQQLVTSGDMRATVKGGDNYVRADDARRWLGGRGVEVQRGS